MLAVVPGIVPRGHGDGLVGLLGSGNLRGFVGFVHRGGRGGGVGGLGGPVLVGETSGGFGAGHGWFI